MRTIRPTAERLAEISDLLDCDRDARLAAFSWRGAARDLRAEIEALTAERDEKIAEAFWRGVTAERQHEIHWHFAHPPQGGEICPRCGAPKERDVHGGC